MNEPHNLNASLSTFLSGVGAPEAFRGSSRPFALGDNTLTWDEGFASSQDEANQGGHPARFNVQAVAGVDNSFISESRCVVP